MELAVVQTLCSHCQQRTAVAGSLAWYAYIPSLLLGASAGLDEYCSECTASRNFLALLLWVPVAIMVFVVAVVAFM